jgi:hypothetical protein
MGNLYSYFAESEIEPSEKTINNRNLLMKEVKKRKVVLNPVKQDKTLFESVIIPNNNKKNKKKKKRNLFLLKKN